MACRQLDILATAASLVALLLLYAFFYRPLIMSLDEDIKSVRNLLLLLPDEVARNVPAVLEYSQALMLSGLDEAVGAGHKR